MTVAYTQHSPLFGTARFYRDEEISRAAPFRRQEVGLVVAGGCTPCRFLLSPSVLADGDASPPVHKG